MFYSWTSICISSELKIGNPNKTSIRMPVNSVLWIPHNHGEELKVKALSSFSFLCQRKGVRYESWNRQHSGFSPMPLQPPVPFQLPSSQICSVQPPTISPCLLTCAFQCLLESLLYPHRWILFTELSTVPKHCHLRSLGHLSLCICLLLCTP